MKSSSRATAIQKQKENRGKVLYYTSNLSAQADKIVCVGIYCSVRDGFKSLFFFDQSYTLVPSEFGARSIDRP